MAGFDPGRVDLGDDAGAAGNFQRLGLCARHSTEPGGDEGLAGKVAVVRYSEVEPAGVEKRDVGSVDDALGADVHPAAGSHLAVVDAAQSGQAVEIFRRVEEPDHQPIGDDGARRLGARRKEPERVAGADDKSLGVIHDLEVALDELVLHPVLADLAGFSIGHELVGVEGD